MKAMNKKKWAAGTPAKQGAAAKPTEAVRQAASAIQANIATAGLYAPTSSAAPRTRDWQTYFFFRILPEPERAQLVNLYMAAGSSDARLKLEFELHNPGATIARDGSAAPATAFRDWLRIITGSKETDAQEFSIFAGVDDMVKSATADVQGVVAAIGAAWSGLRQALEVGKSGDPADWPKHTGRAVIEQGLAVFALHEAFRHIGLSQSNGAVRDAITDGALSEVHLTSGPFDVASINVAFTHGGLSSLNLDPTTLQSFPEPFRDGMAARATLLGDTGANAPENWYGELGSKRIHGFFTGGFLVVDAPEYAWKQMRRQIHEFNSRSSSEENRRLTELLRILFGLFGMEILHIELGQAPYKVQNNVIEPITPRVEHFGYRDGISQPFLDMSLRRARRGSETPRRNRTWAPAAPGEIYLGLPDEDGQVIHRPANADLSVGSTYLVFRKLAQDVVGFRNFLKQQRPDSFAEQEMLGAQMVGRWKNGSSLVLAPAEPLAGDDETINDFRYAADDPKGAKCPLGAHIRRTNPRDIGDRNQARRHRLMRRSMAYGGSLLEDNSLGDGEERGLLFVAANSRIDMQFEVVQGQWINGGEFLGQTGLSRCPLTGANNGGPNDSFLERQGQAPITGMPRFVTLRGGDYFFLPSLNALKKLSDPANKFAPDATILLHDGHSFGDVRTEELFSEKRIREIVGTILTTQRKAIGARLPALGQGGGYEEAFAGRDVVFVGTYDDVREVLRSNPLPGQRSIYTAAHSRLVGATLLRCGNLLVGTDWGHPTEKEREILTAILEAAWSWRSAGDWRLDLEAITTRSLRNTVLRIAPAGHVDLVRDFAADAVYEVVATLFGTPGPDHLTELAFALPFSRAHIGQVDPEWLSSLKGDKEENPALATFKIWSYLVALNLVGDLTLQRKIRHLGIQAASEAVNHFDNLIDQARSKRGQTKTLLDAFVAAETMICNRFALSPNAYYAYVRALVFEVSLTASAIIPSVFGSLMDAIFSFNLNLPVLLKALDQKHNSIVRLIYELNRVRPTMPIVTRYCESPDAPPPRLPSGAQIQDEQWIAALVVAANLDATAFPHPTRFSLELFAGDPVRDLQKYLMFGVVDTTTNPPPRKCWGRDRVALYMLMELVRTAAMLPGLRRVAGPSGEIQRNLGITASLKGKFAPFTPS